MIEAREIAVEAADGHRFQLLARIPAAPSRSVLWLPALGIAAKHYVAMAEVLAARGVAVFVHEWRGHGSSTLRADATRDWGYRELLLHDIPASAAAVAIASPAARPAIGGHSLGGQLACCHLALQPGSASSLWLAGSGAPYWRAFPTPSRWMLPLAYRFLPWLAQRAGYLPGRRIGFGGNEARSLIRDWARTAITGHYQAQGVDTNLEAALARVSVPVRAALFDNDWLAPESSLRFLLSKLATREPQARIFGAATLGAAADHYAWMKRPEAVADWFLSAPQE
ncbi:alpha/beta fold hydrolase [Luteimonas aestuarii]|uniref:Alpha/beta fold hydrolase n=1 Tax=Luteimonas aestuarii TaxID=453837 RepID=A0A4R5U437_9GAMM|nr:alpha/beta fold hydrolase [Luteimonas aestuarii]TDK28492.1 alpha/beta fold hydrolase [Luteimonas aestuarii]